MFEFVQRVQPDNGPVAKLVARAYLAQNNADAAITALTLYLKKFPDDVQATVLLASAQLAAGRNSVAADLMQQALGGRDSADMHTTYGLSLLATGQTDDALAQLKQALAKNPADASAAFALVGLYLRTGDVPTALALAKDMVARLPANPTFVYLLGEVKTRARDAGRRAGRVRAGDPARPEDAAGDARPGAVGAGAQRAGPRAIAARRRGEDRAAPSSGDVQAGGAGRAARQAPGRAALAAPGVRGHRRAGPAAGVGARRSGAAPGPGRRRDEGLGAAGRQLPRRPDGACWHAPGCSWSTTTRPVPARR